MHQVTEEARLFDPTFGAFLRAQKWLHELAFRFKVLLVKGRHMQMDSFMMPLQPWLFSEAEDQLNDPYFADFWNIKFSFVMFEFGFASARKMAAR
jgi:hypothetical protein